MSKCYTCGQSRERTPKTLRQQWLEADLGDKVPMLFFGVLMLGVLTFMVIGAVASCVAIADGM